MDFSTIGSINSYTKTLKMQIQWNLKKQSGDITSHTSSADEWLSGTSASTQEDESGTDEKLTSIQQKVYAGKTLTYDEKQYLQAKDPLTYQKLQANEQEQKAYERELKKCRTKEDVQRLKLSRVGSALAAVKSIENNPHISQAQKLQMASLENAKCEKLERITQAFVKSGRYARLPTEAEEAKAEKELQDAKQAKQTPDSKQAAQPKDEQAEAAGAEAPHTEAETDPLGAKPDSGHPTPSAREKPSAAVEPDSPEIRKVRRTKAQAAYAAAQTDTVYGADAALDVRA